MGYGSYAGGQGGGYQGGGGYQKREYQRPQKPPFDLNAECFKYAEIYETLVGTLESKGIKIEDVKDYIGGWVSGIKITGDKSN